MEERLIETTEKSIRKILDEGINTNNLDHLYKLTKINHIAREDEDTKYGNYGRYDYDKNYGARRRDSRGRYMGHDYIDRLSDHYGRYEEDRKEYNRGNYGVKEDTLKSLEYMLESVCDFMEILKSEANSQEEVNLIRRYAQRISQI